MTPASAQTGSALVSRGRLGRSIGASTATGNASEVKAPVTPPENLETALETAFKKCEADYLESLRARFIPEPATTRDAPYETSQDLENRRIEYKLKVTSNFIHIDNSSATELIGKYVREYTRCKVVYDESSKQLKSQNEIAIEETTRPK